MTYREQTIEVYQSYFAVARQLKKLAHQSAAKLGLTVHQIGILNFLLGHPGQTQKEVTERLVFNKSRVSLHIDALALKGLVNRAVSEQDRRETKLYLTPAGEALCQQYNGEAWSHQVLGEALEQFTEQELKQLIHMNKQLLLHLNP
ncbi:MarR family winged helix-turn-helix transcriptional regulator [Paenibacillus sp. S150]|uniref:MarR family winged helix-turn-helix transcriptional regulator n=1 Tax=Paenibacillus sp. S150 TaxID=2749826 RepID=UPI001C5629EA|nr:MarR family transcriptional regulator [Paenibacillus sp. S150]MBW4083352.1 MarR family transcriptional regulator [Paenibacillus sp. S150]